MSLSKIPLSELMKRAFERHILVPAFNISYLPQVKPVVETLRSLGTFGLVEVARPDIEKFEAKSFRKVWEEFNLYADRDYVRLHQDHIPVIDEEGERVDWEPLIREALRLGYDSVMIDGSRLPLEENIKVTKKVAKLAHGEGVPLEAELGAVLGHERGPLPPYEEIFNSGLGFTRPEEAEEFVRETGVDWLSVAIGNIHGAISGVRKDEKKVKARLNVEHLKKISSRVKIPLVLHGGSGIEFEYLLEAVKNGITKINIGTEIRQTYERSLKEKEDIKYAREKVVLVVKKLIENYKIKGSAEKLKEG